MDNENKEDQPKVNAEDKSIAIGGISIGGDVSGNITIGHTGYTVEQVSVLITQITSTFQPKPFDGRCPYKGLEVFEEEDAELFFGRERLVEDLVSRVKESRTVFITGPSGSGKSSLVRAGLIPALKLGALKKSDHWLYATITPGRNPIEALARAFSRLKSPELADYFQQNVSRPEILNKCVESVLAERKDQRLVLFIDQFEEIFTQLSQHNAETFINLLDHATTVENGRVFILFAMRSDFVSNCATFPQLNTLLNRQFIQIGAMQPEELVSAIAQPALRVGLRIDPDLIAQIINDMQGEPGALPLMQFALKDLFDSQQAEGAMIALTLTDYLQHGGIHKALERHADNSFHKLDGHEQELARSIFTGLIEIGRGTQDTKRTAIFDELIPASANADEIAAIVRKLADARLITTDEIAGKHTVTISHEKLIDAWPWLKRLVNENRDVIALQNEIAADAKEWDEHKRDASYLYSGARLATANEQLKANKLMLSGVASEFVRAGQAQKRRGRVILISSVSTIFVLLIVTVIIFASLTKEAQNQARIANAGELSALALAESEKHFDLALLLGLEGFNTFSNPRTRSTLLNVADSHPELENYLFGHTNPVSSIAFSPDGKTLASGSWDTSVILWDISDLAAPSQLATLTGHTHRVYSVAFSPDGKQLASGSFDTSIILWDISDPSAPSQLGTLEGHSAGVYSVAFSPDGKQLASGSSDDSIILWDIRDPSAPSQLAKLSGHTDQVYIITFSPDGKQLASGSIDTSIILWDIRDPAAPFQLATLAGHTDYVVSVTFSPDGKQLASGSWDNSIILWDISDPTAPSQLTSLAGHINQVSSVAFSPDGKRLASGSYDASIILWDISDPAAPSQLASLAGHTNLVFSVAFSPDGKRLASGSWDTSIILWDISDPTVPSQLARLSGHTDGVISIALSPDGKQLASGSSDDSIILWDISDPTAPSQLARLSGHTDGVISVAFSPDGQRLASGSWDTSIILWDISDPAAPFQLATLAGHTEYVGSVAFSPDGKQLASGSADTSIILWDISDPTAPSRLVKLRQASVVASVAFSPDGKHLASGSWDTSIILWDISDPAAPSRLAKLAGHSNEVSSVVFSPDSQRLASGSYDTSIILWDISDPTAPSQLASLAGHTSVVYSIAFSPDGKQLASGSSDHSIILWDISDPTVPSQLASLAGHTNIVYGVAFSLDGKQLASGSSDHSIILWDVDIQNWIERACQRAGRNFSIAEWTEYFPNVEYRKTCEQWPLEAEPTAAP